jgi:hypothetical protein
MSYARSVTVRGEEAHGGDGCAGLLGAVERFEAETKQFGLGRLREERTLELAPEVLRALREVLGRVGARANGRESGLRPLRGHQGSARFVR